MKLVVFILVYPIIWILSVLPMRVLYVISDFFYFLLYYIIGYRRKVVFSNLKLAFPQKTESELKRIEKKFYRHLTDLVVESIKGFTISEKEINKRYVYKNPEVIDQIANKGKDIALMGAHQANWEWTSSLPLHVNIKCFAAYTKIQNPHFNKLIVDSRTKFGYVGYPTTRTVKEISNNVNNKIQGLYLLLSDQSPQVQKTHYWSEFLGIKVPIHTGGEMLSKKYNMAVVNYSVTKVKRGYFEVFFEVITENPNELGKFEITDKYITITERNIHKQPEYYLWSHKRFKHRDKVPQEWK